MISSIFHAALYNPIYNALVALVAVIPGGEVGVAVIALTIVIRIVLLPLSLAVARSQRRMRELEPKLKELKEKYPNKQEQAAKTLELYRTERVNPFTSILPIFIQIPVLLALFLVFRYEPFSSIHIELLYAFTPVPGNVSDSLFGLIAMGEKSMLLAVLAGGTQYLQSIFALRNAPKPEGTGMQADFSRAMNVQVKYVFPILIGAIAYSTSAAIALYFVTTNIIGTLQELYVQRKFSSKANVQIS